MVLPCFVEVLDDVAQGTRDRISGNPGCSSGSGGPSPWGPAQRWLGLPPRSLTQDSPLRAALSRMVGYRSWSLAGVGQCGGVFSREETQPARARGHAPARSPPRVAEGRPPDRAARRAGMGCRCPPSRSTEEAQGCPAPSPARTTNWHGVNGGVPFGSGVRGAA